MVINVIFIILCIALVIAILLLIASIRRTRERMPYETSDILFEFSQNPNAGKLIEEIDRGVCIPCKIGDKCFYAHFIYADEEFEVNS